MYEHEEQDVSRMNELQTINHIKNHITDGEGYFDTIYTRCKDDLKMANGTEGSQYSELDRKNRGENRAEFSFPVLDKFVERIVGNYNLSPFGIEYSPYDSAMSDKATVIQAVVSGIETRSKGKSVYRQALRSQSTVGYSWIHVTSEYDNPEDDSLDVSLRIEFIQDYSSVLMDPLSTDVAGCDAKWVAHVDKISLREAKELYGDDVCMYSDEGLFSADLERDLSANTTIKVVTHYEKVTKKKTVYIGEDGDVSEEKIDGYRAKEKTNTYVKCIKAVGNKVVFETELDQTYLPIVPVYGLPIYQDGKPQYVGIIHRAIDSQKLLNYAASAAAERLARSNKTEFVGPARAIQAHADVWENSSKSLYPYLPFDDIDENGNPIKGPIKVDTAINVNDVMPMTQMYLSTISSVVGMSEDGIAGASSAQETAEAALLKAKASETVLSTLYENLASSIEQVGRVLLQMVSAMYDTDRVVPLTQKSGETIRDMVPFTSMNIMPNEYEVAVSAGPLLATQRKENLRSLIAVSQLMGPSGSLILPEIIDSIDLGKESANVKQKAEMIAQMNMQQAQQGPQMQMQLQQSQQQIAQLQQQNKQMEAIIQQLNGQLIDSKVDLQRDQMKIEADLLKTNMNNEAKLDIQRLKGGQQSVLEDQKAENSMEKTITEQQMELMRQMAENQAEIDARQNLLNNFR